MITLTQKLNSTGSPDGYVTLPYDKRIKSRLRVQLDDGRQAGLFLQRGTVLRGGDLLRSDQGDVVQVKAAPEKVSRVSVAEPLLMAKVCYHLGNRHVPVQIGQNIVMYQADHVLDEMVRSMGLAVHQDVATFEPETGAYSNNSHHHEHAH